VQFRADKTIIRTEIVSYQNYNLTGVRRREISRLYHVVK